MGFERHTSATEGQSVHKSLMLDACYDVSRDERFGQWCAAIVYLSVSLTAHAMRFTAEDPTRNCRGQRPILFDIEKFVRCQP